MQNEIDSFDPKLVIAKQKEYQIEQLALDATRLMSCTQDRINDYQNKGFFKRVVACFSGETAKMERDNQYDLMELQKMSMKYLQHLSDNHLLTVHSLITVKNNLDTLVVSIDETQSEITRLALKVKDRFDRIEERVKKNEIQSEISAYIQRIKVNDYLLNNSPYFRTLMIIKDFQEILLEAKWGKNTVLDLFVALKEAGVEIDNQTTIKEFIENLLVEIESSTFEKFYETVTLENFTKLPVEFEFINESVESPIYKSLYSLVEEYQQTKSNMESIKDNLIIDTSEAIQKAILNQIVKSGVDIEKALYLKNIILEISSCHCLVLELCKEQSSRTNSIDRQATSSNVSNATESDALASMEVENDLNLEVQPNYIGCSSDFCVIVTNQGIVKSIGDNYYGQLGIGNKDNQDKFMDAIDLPSGIKCISISVGYQHVLALLETGDVYAWGRGEEGELGDDTKDIRLSAFKVKGLPKDKKPVKIIAGANSSFILLETGDLYASGNISNSKVFIKYPLPFKVKDVELLYDSDDNGIVVVNSKDEIFIKCLRSYSLDWCRSDDKSELNLLRGLPEEYTINKIITGSNYLFTILSTGEAYAIGLDNEGQLGRGEYTSSSQETFTKIYSIKEKILQIATNKKRSYTEWDSGCYSNFVLVSTPSKIYGWGNNENKQLGEQKEYNIDSSTTGALLWKKTHTYRYYRDLKPKIINQFDTPMKDNIEYYIACTDTASILFDRSQNKFYLLGRKIGARETNDIVTCTVVD